MQTLPGKEHPPEPGEPPPKVGDKEPLLSNSCYEKAAIALNEAIQRRCYKQYPDNPRAWHSYVAFHRFDGWLQMAVVALLMLTIFETPLWCNDVGRGYWSWEGGNERCTVAGRAPAEEVIMSGLPKIPSGIGLIIETVLLTTILLRVTLMLRLDEMFKEANADAQRARFCVSFHYCLIVIGLVDAAIFWMRPSARFRVAPYVRFGLAAMLPWVEALLRSFWGVLVAISKVGFFLAGTVVMFAWVAAMIFDDLRSLDRYGNPINQGFETFGNSLYTSFATMTTAITPDVTIPSYIYSRAFVVLWVPFLFLAVMIFTNVVLATVYSQYQEHATEHVKAGMARQMEGLKAAFEMMKEQTVCSRTCKTHFSVKFEAFVQVTNMLRNVANITADEGFLELLFEALDENNDGTLTDEEFYAMCDVLQTDFQVTTRDSWVRTCCGDGALGRWLRRALDNGAEGPDYGYAARFPGSCFDVFMNGVLALNVVWLLFQSVVDLNDRTESSFFQVVDVFFSLIYLLEVGMKLCYWSWDEYWTSNDNRFDFFTTMILAGSAMGYLFFKLDRAVLRYLNLLRLVRLLKALNNIRAYREVWSVIDRMVRTCSDVLLMNLLVIYLWSAAGVQLFGGQLYPSNPQLEGLGLAYFSSHYEVFNFNDMFMGMVTLFYCTLGTWVDPIAMACIALAEKHSLIWFITWAFLLSFYIASPLLAFNVFTSFSIDVFNQLQDMDTEAKDSQVSHNLADLKDFMAEHGYCLHIQEQSELSRLKVVRKMFNVE